MLKHLPRRGLGRCRSLFPVQKAGHRIGQHDLRTVDLGPAQGAQTLAFVDRKFGEHLHELADICIGHVSPPLPELVGCHLVGVQPDRTVNGFAHLLAIRPGYQWRRKPESLGCHDTPDQVRSRNDVPPLVRSAHLQDGVVSTVKFQKIVSLQQHVVEFDETQRLLPVQARLHAFKRQQSVDREMRTDVAQKVYVSQLVEPFGIVDEGRVRRSVAIGDVARENRPDAFGIRVDLINGKHLSHFILA